MKRIIPFLAIIFLLFTACSKEESPKYDLVLCDKEMTDMSVYLNSFENDNFSVEDIEFNAETLDNFIISADENSKYITSVTLYSQNITNDIALKFIEFAGKANIPVVFAFSDISSETLLSYDKAFCIISDYEYAGEITAKHIKQLWNDGIISDSNENKIFAFSVIKDDISTWNYETFHNTLIACIELYGIPMQINSTVSSAEITSAEKLSELKSENEALIVISDDVFPYVTLYSTESENVEIIAIQQNTENHLSDVSFAANCFIDYKNYKFAVDEILRNYNNRQYPLIEMSFPVKDRTVFIPATI